MSRPRLLDLFCGAGGAAEGYRRAGFDVVGYDIEPQPHYPFEFRQVDALVGLRALLRWDHPYAAVHASPPCQGSSSLRAMWPDREYPELIPPTRGLLRELGLPYVIENVPGAALREPVTLCGSMFGLRVARGWLRRHRLFESSFALDAPPCAHPPGERAVGVYGHGGHAGKHRMLAGDEARAAMGINWMNRDELAQAIPPAYTEHIGAALLATLSATGD